MSLFACDSEEVLTDPCAPQPISDDLTPVFYWGGEDPNNWEPFNGMPIGAASYPAWTSDTSFVVSTSAMRNGVEVQGIAQINLDINGAFSSYEFFEFPGTIQQIDYDLADRELYVLHDAAVPGKTGVVEVALLSGYVQVVDTLGRQNLSCVGMSAWYSRSGVIVYCDDEFPNIGMFWFGPSGADSLIVQAFVSHPSAKKFGVSSDGSRLFFVLYYNTYSLIHEKVPIDGPSNPIIQAQIDGFVESIDVHREDESLLLVQRHLSSSRIECLDLTSGDLELFDTRVTSNICGEKNAAYPRWHPSIDKFLFSSWTESKSTVQTWTKTW